MTDCSMCTGEAAHHITVRCKEPEPEPGQTDTRGMRIIRFCENCWSELLRFLPAV